MGFLRSHQTDVVASGFWVAAVAFFVAAAAVGPEGECVRANYDAQVASSRVAGLLLFVCAFAVGGAAVSLLVGAARARSQRGKVVRAILGLASLGVACLTGFFALLAIVALQCLE